jgi:NADH:ubiquinone oxidoreductase subunit F (NADH-binding)/NADH:ubiquinone oxidoreductase subunit E/ferredoxin
MLLQRLVAIQERDGHLRREAMEALVAELRRDGVEVKLRHLHEVASFYPHFRLHPPPAAEVHVCRDMACHMNGSAGLRNVLKARLAEYGETVHVEGCSCLGQCDRAPAVRVNDRDCSLRDPEAIVDLVAELVEGRRKHHDIPQEPIGPPPDWQIDVYGDRPPDYRVLRAYAADPDPLRVIGGRRDGQAITGLLETASLLGLGGPGQRSWLKWQDVRGQDDPVKFVVCNADESEPGTFKDREILLHFPHLTIEGMILAGLVVGAQRGFIYIRHEYERQIEATRQAIRRAYELDALGPDVMGTGRPFDMEVFVSPGGYICGEATALIEAMEDRRSEPRNRPPELTVKGLFDRPTLVNNVETFAWVPFILKDDAVRYVAAGAAGSKGRRLFSISGDVARPGVYEVPVGSTLGELIELAGGTPRGLKAIATSGPSGGFVPPRITLNDDQRRSLGASRRPALQSLARTEGPLNLLGVPLDHETFRALKLALGAAIVVYDSTRDMAEQALNAAQFFQAESCGKCVPCRLGSRRVVELAERMCGPDRDHPSAYRNNKALALQLADAMEEGSICGLGQVASKPLTSAISGFVADFMPTRTLLPTLLPGQIAEEPPPEIERPARPGEDDFFSRDLLGHLVRMDEPTRAMLEEPVILLIDGQEIEITRAVHATDPYGELLYDREGKPVPRRTTLYDAVCRRYPPEKNPVPVLCYQEHMSPAAVCRVCLVRLGKPARGRDGSYSYRTEVVPSCFYPVEVAVGKPEAGSPPIRIETAATVKSNDPKAPQQVGRISRVIVEMLAADHFHPEAHREYDFNALVERLGLADGPLRFESPARDTPPDATSPWFVIDRTACILCDRCIRGCGEARGHYVIARAGKGANARIAFDWDSPMGASTCVQCGECFISCPTDAITIRPGTKPSPWIEEARLADRIR